MAPSREIIGVSKWVVKGWVVSEIDFWEILLPKLGHQNFDHTQMLAALAANIWVGSKCWWPSFGDKLSQKSVSLTTHPLSIHSLIP